jgi:hypothetical protein
LWRKIGFAATLPRQPRARATPVGWTKVAGVVRQVLPRAKINKKPAGSLRRVSFLVDGDA